MIGDEGEMQGRRVDILAAPPVNLTGCTAGSGRGYGIPEPRKIHPGWGPV
jgi:hypothetical protein